MATTTTTPRRQLGETFGHVVPGVFYVTVSVTLFLWMWRQWRVMMHGTAVAVHPNEVLYATNGGSQFLRFFGWTCMVISATGFVIEGAGGVLSLGDFFFQSAHETMYMAFLLAGVVAILESHKRIAFDSWRRAMTVAFVVEGMVFYGHQLEQKETEQALHYVMVQFSFFTALCFFWGTREPRSLLPHALALVGMCVKGLWFFVIADVLYSGRYGHEGMMFMTGNVYMTAGIMFMFVSSVYGCFFITKQQQPNTTECCEDDGTSEFHGYAPSWRDGPNGDSKHAGKYRVVSTGVDEPHSTSNNHKHGDAV